MIKSLYWRSDLIQNHSIMRFKEFGMIIKERRKVLGVTQLQLADIAGISKNTLYKIERGQNNPTIQVLNSITDVLGLEIILQVKTP